LGRGQCRNPDDLLRSGHELKEGTTTDSNAQTKQLTPALRLRVQGVAVPLNGRRDAVLEGAEHRTNLLRLADRGGDGDVNHPHPASRRLCPRIGLLQPCRQLLGGTAGLDLGERGLLGLALHAPDHRAGALLGTGIAKLLQEYGLLVLATDAQAKGKGLNNGVLGQ
jgi:hypothetical protein